MSQQSRSDHVEFVRLNGQAIRVTSWAETERDHFRLVAIVRGVGDARALADVLAARQLSLEVAGEAPRGVVVAALDRRETGNPPAVITRFAIDFAPAGEAPVAAETATIEERVSHLERDVEELRMLIKALANDR